MQNDSHLAEHEGSPEIGGYVSWRKLYDSCVCETNLAKLGKLVFETEDAIYLRSRELSKESHIGDEVRELSRAAKVLLEIRITKLGWPDPFKTNHLN